MKNINYGIDLGTTNSGIACYENGIVTIFKNPVGLKDTIPSVVSFRKGRIQVGDKAREWLTSDAENVVASFKRKMGSSETFYIPNIDENKTPVDLSAMVLKELLNFIPENQPESVVITIPASFDTIQSNATKKAGYQAGFKEVVLLQEPIAACLAYANSQNIDITQEQKWLVYDFGGGTFDVALVHINSRDLKIIDHKGNNFLGGVDIDNLFIEKLICPTLEIVLKEENLWKKLTAEKQYSQLYFELLFKAEEAKKELSVRAKSIIEIEDDALDLFCEIPITVQQFNQIIVSKFQESFQLTESLLTENALSFNQIEKIILVGGTTYIPYIRQQLREKTNIEVDTHLDPTTAVIIGAAYYAGSKVSALADEKTEKEISIKTTIQPLKFNVFYEPNTQDSEELIVGFCEEPFNGFYRIIRKDGGFDTGIQKMEQKFQEFVTILDKKANFFTVTIYDENQNVLWQKDDVTISSGLYNISGQPLPNDIGLEIDNEKGKTHVEKIFSKNDILPLKKTLYKTTSRTILKNSDDKLIINVLEGKAGTLPASNLSIGYIELSGKQFQEDLLKGMDIELNFSISESRDLSINVYISSLDLEIKEVFNPHQRTISKNKLLQEIQSAIDEISHEIDIENASESENYSYLSKLKNIADELTNCYGRILELDENDTTEQKYQIDEQKRTLLQAFDDMVRSKNILAEIEEYKTQKQLAEDWLERATEKQRNDYQNIIKNEKEFLASNDKILIRKKAKELDKLTDNIYYQQDESKISSFLYYKMKDLDDYIDQRKAQELINLGDRALDRNSYNELNPISNSLYNLLRNKPKWRHDDDFEGNQANTGLK